MIPLTYIHLGLTRWRKVIERLWRGIAIISASDNGYKVGEELRQKLKDMEIPTVHFKYQEAKFEEIWECYDAIIFVMALEGVVRTISKLARAKHLDPPVVSIDDSKKYIIPVLGGHWGANEIARDLSDIIGGEPIITTASELMNKPSAEEIAGKLIAEIVNPEMIVKINSAFLKGEEVCFLGNEKVNISVLKDYHEECKNVITTREGLREMGKNVLYLKPLKLAIGIGSKKEVDVNKIWLGISSLLEKMEIDKSRIKVVASIREKLKEISERLNAEFRLINEEEIKEFSYPCLTPPNRKLIELGLKGVAEVSALIATGSRKAKLVLRKVSIGNEATIAIASYD